MSSPVMIDDTMLAAVSCDVQPNSKVHSSSGSCEPKQAFADTAPLAKIREELKPNKTDSPEVSLEGQANGEPMIGYDSHPEEQVIASEHPELAVDGPPVDMGGEHVSAWMMTLTAEECVAQGNPTVMVPSETSHEDAASPTRVPEQPIAACSQAIPEAAVGGQAVAVESQEVLGKEVLGKEVMVDLGGVGQSGAVVAPVEDAVGAEKVVPIEPRTQGDGMPQVKADPAVSATPEANPGQTPPDAESDVARTPVLEAVVGADGSSRPEEVGTGTTEAVVKTPVQAAEPVLSGDAQTTQSESDALPVLASERVQGDASSSNSVAEKVSPQAPVSTPTQGEMQETGADGHSKAGHFFDTKDGAKSSAEVLDLPQDATVASVERLATRSANASGMAGDAATVKNPVQEVGEQILGSVHASLARGDRQLLVRLDPPELGSVVVRFEEQGDQVSGVLEVSRDETRREIEQALPEVLRSLQEAGVQVRRLDVADQLARDPGREQMQQDAGAQREGSNQQGEHPERSSQSGWSALRGAGQSPFGQSHASESHVGVGPGRIDLLI